MPGYFPTHCVPRSSVIFIAIQYSIVLMYHSLFLLLSMSIWVFLVFNCNKYCCNDIRVHVFVGAHISFGEKPRNRVMGPLVMHMFSFHIAKQCVYHFTLTSAVFDSSSRSFQHGIFCRGHTVKTRCPVFRVVVLQKSQILSIPFLIFVSFADSFSFVYSLLVIFPLRFYLLLFLLYYSTCPRQCIHLFIQQTDSPYYMLGTVLANEQNNRGPCP